MILNRLFPFLKHLAVFAALSIPVGATAQDSATAQTAEAPVVRIMSWNVENFTDPFDSPYIQDDRENAGASKSEEVLEAMAQAIRMVDPDVLALQEIEGDAAVKLFLDSFLPGHEYKHFSAVPAMEWYQNCVVASKHPLGPIMSFREMEMENEVLGTREKKYNARIVFTEVRVSEEYRFLLGNLHLKAGSDPEDPVWRREQIKLIKSFVCDVQKSDPATNVVLVGDMNYTAATPEYRQMLTDGGCRLVDPFADAPQLSHASRSPTRQIDFAFFNEAMAPEYVPGSAAVARPLSLNQLARISDHLPVVISFSAVDAPPAVEPVAAP